MKKIEIILIIVIILLIACFAVPQFLKDDSVKVGDSTFTLPEGFSVSNEVSSTNVVIGDGKDLLGIIEYKDNNIKKYMNDYKNNKSDGNVSVDTTKFTVDNIEVYKSVTQNNTKIIHYWFINNNKVYSIYTWYGNDNTDNLVTDLIKTMKT